MNIVSIIGHLGRDPEVRYLPSGKALCSFSIAYSEKWKGNDGTLQEHTSWFDITAFGRQAELCGQYLHKGSQVGVEGKLKQEKWEQDGQARSAVKIVANRVTFLGGKQSGGAGGFEREPLDDQDVPF